MYATCLPSMDVYIYIYIYIYISSANSSRLFFTRIVLDNRVDSNSTHGLSKLMDTLEPHSSNRDFDPIEEEEREGEGDRGGSLEEFPFIERRQKIHSI